MRLFRALLMVSFELTTFALASSKKTRSHVRNEFLLFRVFTGICLIVSIGPVSSVSLSGDENVLLTSTLDNTIRLLDKEDGSLYQARDIPHHSSASFN